MPVPAPSSPPRGSARVVVLVSGSGTNLQAMLDTIAEAGAAAYGAEIVAVGADVDRPLKIGQRVSAEGHVIDLNSEAARAGHFHLDPDTRGIGVNRQGAFAEYVVAPAFNVIELPEDVPFEIGAILDPFGNAVHTAQQFDLLGVDTPAPSSSITIRADGREFRADVRIDTPMELDFYRHGGILPYVLRSLAS